MLEPITLDRLLDPIGECLTPEVARQLVSLRAAPELQERVDLLASKCNQGELTPEEREEYELYVRTNSFIALLLTKARARLGVFDVQGLPDCGKWECLAESLSE
jgi:hypothetical protein